MTTIVAVHGAFRGPWYWDALRELLADRGHELIAVDLTGAADGTSSGDVTMAEWTGRVVSAVDVGRDHGEEVVLLGHSMGGVVAQGAVPATLDRVARLVLLDAPLIEAGQRPVDVSGPAPPDPAQLPPRTTWIPPSPVGTAQGFDEATAERVNDLLTPVPMGPQLDAMPAGTGRHGSTTLVFCERTPDFFPSALARRRCEAEGLEHHVLDADHDVALLAPGLLLPFVLPD